MSDKISLDPRTLKIADLKRARAGPLEGRNPIELFDDPLESATLVVWCMRSRDDPEFTWADAEQAELGDFEQFADQPEGDAEGGQPDPPGASPGEPSARPPSDAKPASTPKPPKPEPPSSSASSSASTGPPTSS